jgi:DNA-binding PadR family transcriptional regulator
MPSPTPRAQTSLTDVALGLVVERPGRSSEVVARLNERLGATQFTEQAVRKALRQLERQGLVRLENGEYLATAMGVAQFERWLWASLSLPPVREELLAKVALCRVEDLPRLIAVVRDVEFACVSRVGDLNRVLRERRRVAERVRGHHPRRVVVVMGAEVAWWEGRIKWLQRLRGDLAEEWEQFQGESPPGSSPRGA